ncbi:unnamed protein product [Nesidiocoris tenuis]|uniref:Uncharacterized protein n=1 Tax=Nesidiocoris tenuis TaxID=355587 RepID=A0A6H5HM35_9HEMI|nr:unnamed protein product [Nesidiocoris tenuis]CAB0019224.1 unnamed protein product [Nesidiocoris tenuis]
MEVALEDARKAEGTRLAFKILQIEITEHHMIVPSHVFQRWEQESTYRIS